MIKTPRNLVVAAALASLVALPAGTAAASSGVITPATAGRVTATSAAAPSSQVTLVNGDRALITHSAGGVRAVVTSAPVGPAAALMTLRQGDKTYLIPSTALPFLGRGLDLSLFDVALLQRTERNGRLPVTLHYRGSLHAPPGITVTRTEKGIAQGYLTMPSATRLGVALGRQLASDYAQGSYGTDGLFAGGLSVSLSGAPAPAPAARPAATLHTLTVTGTDLAGKPDNGDIVFVNNVNDPAAVTISNNSFFQGAAKYSVPSGTYWAFAAYVQLLDHGHVANVRTDVLPQFTVSGDTTVSTKAAAATSKVAITTPRRAVLQNEGLTVLRSAPNASPSSVAWEVLGAGNSIFVNPVSSRPTDGTLLAITDAQLISPAGKGTPYSYALELTGKPGTIPAQRFTVRPASLATVSEQYFQDEASTGGWVAAGGTLFQFDHALTSVSFKPVRLPGRQTLYLSAAPGTIWELQYLEHTTIFTGETAGGQTSEPFIVHPGEHLSENWNQYPLHVAPNVNLPGNRAGVLRSSADRIGDTLNLDVNPFSDNQLGHVGYGLLIDIPGKKSPVHGTYALYQNGVKVVGGDALKVTGGFGDTQLAAKVKPGKSVIKYVLDASRASAPYRLSATSHDVWTWRTQDRPATLLPKPWSCDFLAGEDDRCAVEPMMTLSYQVAGIGLTGKTRPGQQSISFTAGHIQLAQASRITKAGLAVSYDGGKTWHQAKVTRTSGGKFRAVFTAPKNATVTLRTSAADAAGGTITETITSAYQTSA